VVVALKVFLVLFKTALGGLEGNRARTKATHLRHHDKFVHTSCKVRERGADYTIEREHTENGSIVQAVSHSVRNSL
jgi:hypothetical protein